MNSIACCQAAETGQWSRRTWHPKWCAWSQYIGHKATDDNSSVFATRWQACQSMADAGIGGCANYDFVVCHVATCDGTWQVCGRQRKRVMFSSLGGVWKLAVGTYVFRCDQVLLFTSSVVTVMRLSRWQLSLITWLPYGQIGVLHVKHQYLIKF